MFCADRRPVQSGLDTLLTDHLDLLRGRKVGLLVNPTSCRADLIHAIDALREAGIPLHCLFGPEHGIQGEAQDMVQVDSTVESTWGAPVYSLYGATIASLRPPAEALRQIDLLVIDLQDIGTRYYTYVWTTWLAIQACADQNVEVLLLDRPNPVGGLAVEGPGIQPGFESFVGLYSIPVRHGLTIGELMQMIAQEQRIDISMKVLKLKGWHRGLFFHQTTLPWVLPSPNMPTIETALVYPGACLLEGTNLSEGRGTTRPFEIFGAPWIHGRVLADTLVSLDLPGVRFRPLTFRPSFHKHAQQVCGGLQIHITDPVRFLPFRTMVALLLSLHRLWPEELQWRHEVYEFVTDRLAIDLLAGGTWLREGIEQDATLHDLAATWSKEEDAFYQRRAPFLLYPAGS